MQGFRFVLSLTHSLFAKQTKINNFIFAESIKCHAYAITLACTLTNFTCACLRPNKVEKMFLVLLPGQFFAK